jgi:hypothetical protein
MSAARVTAEDHLALFAIEKTGTTRAGSGESALAAVAREPRVSRSRTARARGSMAAILPSGPRRRHLEASRTNQSGPPSLGGRRRRDQGGAERSASVWGRTEGRREQRDVAGA